MKLKHGKKYETADGVVYRVRDGNDGYFDESDDKSTLWRADGSGLYKSRLYKSRLYSHNLIRRHYTKPKPAHKLDLKPGDIVELVAWEDGFTGAAGRTFNVGLTGPEGRYLQCNLPKGERPLFRVVPRANSPKQPS